MRNTTRLSTPMALTVLNAMAPGRPDLHLPPWKDRAMHLSSGLSAAAALVAISLCSGVAAAAPVTALANVTDAALPTVKITMNNRSLTDTSDAFDFQPGLVHISVTGNSNCPVWFIRLHDGYSFSDFRHDQYAMFEGDASARQRLWANSDYVGGLHGRAGQTVTGTIVLPTAGDYVITSYAGEHLTRPIRFHLAGSPRDRGTADYDSSIVVAPTGQWQGDTQLPTTGTLRFANNDSIPHELNLQPVADGTTVEQVRDWFAANPGSAAPPPWLAPGPQLAMTPLDTEGTETRDYTDYAPGTYLAFDGLAQSNMLAIVNIGD